MKNHAQLIAILIGFMICVIQRKNIVICIIMKDIVLSVKIYIYYLMVVVERLLNSINFMI